MKKNRVKLFGLGVILGVLSLIAATLIPKSVIAADSMAFRGCAATERTAHRAGGYLFDEGRAQEVIAPLLEV